MRPPRLSVVHSLFLPRAPFAAHTLAGVLLATTALGAQDTARATTEPTSLMHAYVLARQAIVAGDQHGVRRALRAALVFAPNDGIARFHLARAEALTGHPEAALRSLEGLTVQGVARDVTSDTAFAALRAGPLASRFQEIAQRLRTAAAPLVSSDTAFALEDPDFIPEGIAYDSVRGDVYVGSLNSRGVIRVSRGGEARPFLRGDRRGLDQVLGLRVDAPRRRLWLATLVRDSAAPRFRDGIGGWSALHAYDLRSGDLLARYPAPDSTSPQLLNDIALAPNGDLYVTDSEGGALYRLRRGASALERVHGGVSDFTYPNGVTVSSDGRWLYVAHVEGLSAFPLRGGSRGRPVRLPTLTGVAAGGIDGLYTCADGLLAVQTLVDFQQITWFRLAADGARVSAVEAVERRHPAYDVATTGALAGDAFVYIASSQLQRLRPEGVAPAPRATRSVVLRLPLRGRCRIAAPGVTPSEGPPLSRDAHGRDLRLPPVDLYELSRYAGWGATIGAGVGLAYALAFEGSGIQGLLEGTADTAVGFLVGLSAGAVVYVVKLSTGR